MVREPNCDNARSIDFIPFGPFLCVFVQFFHAFLYTFVVRFPLSSTLLYAHWMHLHCTRMFIITARRSYASAVLGVVILSVCPSATNPKNLPAIFLYLILITVNMQSKTGFPSNHQLKSYVGPKSRLKLAARCPISGCWPCCLKCRSLTTDGLDSAITGIEAQLSAIS